MACAIGGGRLSCRAQLHGGTPQYDAKRFHIGQPECFEHFTRPGAAIPLHVQPHRQRSVIAERAKRLLLTGDLIDGREAARMRRTRYPWASRSRVFLTSWAVRLASLWVAFT